MKENTVKHQDRFVMSHKLFAVDLSSVRVTSKHTREYNGTHFYSARIDAVWYRRRKGVTVACIGTLWDSQDDEPTNGRQFLERHDDGRYGGDCDGRWDGENYWGAQKPEVMAQHLEILRPMLDNCPTIPVGYDGWWRF